MQGPFDITADLDTPVSAWLKLADLGPRFLLESVEGGERLARYSFLGFGPGREVRLDADGFRVDGESQPLPRGRDELLDGLRQALAGVPRLAPEAEELPFTGALVGVSGYDLVRWFERLPDGPPAQEGMPLAAYVAPESLLVFDHLTRRVALLHAGTEAERRALRAEVIGRLRGAVPQGGDGEGRRVVQEADGAGSGGRVDDATARRRMYMQAAHFFVTDQGDNEYTLGGYYDDELVRTEAGWKIQAVTLNVLWHRGNRHIMQLATEAGAAKLGTAS